MKRKARKNAEPLTTSSHRDFGLALPPPPPVPGETADQYLLRTGYSPLAAANHIDRRFAVSLEAPLAQARYHHVPRRQSLV
jgi:hypothetical protein